MPFTTFKISEYEITFIVNSTIDKINLQKIFHTLFQYITKARGVITNLKVSVKTDSKYNKNKIKKFENSLIYNNISKQYIYTLHVKISPLLLKELIYNLKIRKITSNLICIKHIKTI